MDLDAKFVDVVWWPLPVQLALVECELVGLVEWDRDDDDEEGPWMFHALVVRTLLTTTTSILPCGYSLRLFQKNILDTHHERSITD